MCFSHCRMTKMERFETGNNEVSKPAGQGTDKEQTKRLAVIAAGRNTPVMSSKVTTSILGRQPNVQRWLD